jgi:aspartyl-tRNA(Asn)/glutamyl-tRNA(Gln) amidotransferase subunit A
LNKDDIDEAKDEKTYGSIESTEDVWGAWEEGLLACQSSRNLADFNLNLGQEASKQRIGWVTNKSVAMKDNIVTSKLPTTCASAILQKHQSPFEASVVEQLRSVGASITGKTNLDEFGMGSHTLNSFFGEVTNPPPFSHLSAGGSSGGSAVAVATEQCDVALGTDTGGSVRLPAAYSGVVGFKPSYGMISRWGVIPYANSLDTVGILARSAKRVLQTFASINKPDPRDPTCLTDKTRNRIREQRKQATGKFKETINKKEFGQLRIGVPIEYKIKDGRTRRAWQRTLMLLEEEGCTIVPASLPNTMNALGAYYVIAPAEAASNLSKYDGVRYGSRSNSTDGAGDVLYSNSRGEGFGEEVKRRILLGSYALSSAAIDNYFIKAQKVRRLVQRDFDRVFSMANPLQDPQHFDLSDMHESISLDSKLGPAQVDVIVCPTSPTPAPKLDDIENETSVDTYMNDVFTVPASLAGLPAISIPLEKYHPGTEEPRFDGIQIIGQYADDFRVLSAACELEKLFKFDKLKWKRTEEVFGRSISEELWLERMKQNLVRSVEPKYDYAESFASEISRSGYISIIQRTLSGNFMP